MVTNYKDVTTQFNAQGYINIDTSGWDYVLVQLVSPTGSVNFKGTLDPGDVQGESAGNPLSAQNWLALYGTNTATGSGATSSNASSIFKFNVLSRFLQLSGSSVTATKVMIFFAKIQ
jgi:hypothetical protein